ncbi:hypothetical protein GQ44DRAFT_680494 [Phaeosphaeriaceae sp. PMI808]|nr:hypothetical protein GQ44DRAFT_680494 [Phaeosphaeriaceae sp. PMI808]
MRPQHDPTNNLRIKLAHTLGFPDYPTTATAEPYLNYITNRFVGRGTLEWYLRLVIHVIHHFQADEAPVAPPLIKSIRRLLDTLATSSNDYFTDTKPGSQTRREDVEDTVLYIIGAWTLLLSSFVHLPVVGGARKITLAYGIRAQDTCTTPRCDPYEESLSGLIRGSGILPSAGQWGLSIGGDDDDNARIKAMVQLMATLREPQRSTFRSTSSLNDSSLSLHNLESLRPAQTNISLHLLDDLDAMESLHIAATRLNAYTLKEFGAVDIMWTHNFSRHLLLCKRSGRYVLEVFALPCALTATTLTSDAVGIAPEFAQEIRESYSILFNAWPDTPRHAKWSKPIGGGRICWCWSCSAYRYRKQIVSRYQKLSKRKPAGPKATRFSNLSEFDPLLVELMKNEPSDWTPELFPSLWTRIMVLEAHLQSAKPWNIWILFRDRRDTLQFWTFFFATIVVMLTFVQVILGVAQVAGSFK